MTVPKVIASGETITIPAGRIAVLPNVQVDGTLNISGEVFVPSGATFGDLEAQLALKAPLVSPALTGTPTAPTQTAGNNSTRLATTAYVDGKMVLGTSVNSTSGTAIDFTGIPSWVKKITIMFEGVSTSGSSPIILQIGDNGGIETTSYLSSGTSLANSLATSSYTTGFGIGQITSLSSFVRHGTINLYNLVSNVWIANGAFAQSDVAQMLIGAGSKMLSESLNMVRITTLNGTDTFDAGKISIIYEG